jgi:AcrR family transcriptional regulator
MDQRPVDLAVKRAPRQKRAIETYERILDVTARLLNDIGVERISTNMIAAEAGIKAPTLYRYFPNKYAVLMALSDRLMKRQNTIIEIWIARASGDPSPYALMNDLHFLIENTLTVTRTEPGALAILLAMRAVPVLRNVRLNSHRAMTDLITEHVAPSLPHVPHKTLWLRVRLSVELSYAAIEMALEDPQINGHEIAVETTRQIQAYWREQLPPEFKN